MNSAFVVFPNHLIGGLILQVHFDSRIAIAMRTLRFERKCNCAIFVCRTIFVWVVHNTSNNPSSALQQRNHIGKDNEIHLQFVFITQRARHFNSWNDLMSYTAKVA